MSEEVGDDEGGGEEILLLVCCWRFMALLMLLCGVDVEAFNDAGDVVLLL